MRFLPLALTLLPALTLAAPFEVKRAGSSLPPPTEDPFYKVPATIGFYQPGQVVNKRTVTTNINDNVAESYQISYRTSTTKGDADLTVATVWVPKNPDPDTKIFSYQPYEDSTNLGCAPSWAFTKPTDSANTFVTSLDTPIYIKHYLKKGVYVVSPDHEGSQSAFISKSQGKATLDGIRAIINAQKLPGNSKVGMLGYSGGASATVWAENYYAQGYASELNIIGSVHGGTPIDVRNTFNLLNKSFFAGFAGAGVVGLSNAYPELNQFLQENTTPAGKKKLATYKEIDYCILKVATGSPFTNFFKYITVDDPLNKPVPSSVLAQETLLESQAASPDQIATPKFPRFMFHAKEDGIIPYDDAVTYVKQQCDTGANLAFNTLPLAEHLLAEVEGIAPSIGFLDNIFDGKPKSYKCGTSIEQPSPRSAEAREILGADGQADLLNLNGKQDAFGEILHF